MLKFLLILLLLNFITPQQNVQVLVGTKDKVLTFKDDCTVFSINTNYKHLNIKIKDIKNINKLIITDKRLNSCDLNDCSSNSNICQSNKMHFNIIIIIIINIIK